MRMGGEPHSGLLLFQVQLHTDRPSKEERHESESSGRPQNAHDRLARAEGRSPLP